MAKQEEGIKGRIKSFFGISKGHHDHSSTDAVHLKTLTYILTKEIKEDIAPESPLSQRIKGLKELYDIIEKKNLEPNAVETLWMLIKDLLTVHKPREERQFVFKFLARLAKEQEPQLGMLKLKLFELVKSHKVPEDLSHRLELLKSLTRNGRSWEHGEELCGQLLLSLMREVNQHDDQLRREKDAAPSHEEESPRAEAAAAAAPSHEFDRLLLTEYLQLATTVLKFNMALVNEEELVAIVIEACSIISKTKYEDDVKHSLSILDAVICYKHLPSSTLYMFLICMCQLVFLQAFSHSTWQLVRKLFGTHLGPHAIFLLCIILQDNTLPKEKLIPCARGAIFFVGMVMWGHNRISSLHQPISSVLPALLKGFQRSHSSVVANELAISIQRLVSRHCDELHIASWDNVLNITEALLKHLETCGPAVPDLVANVHNLLAAIEVAEGDNKFVGKRDRLYGLSELCASKRPDSAIVKLLNYKASKLLPDTETWLMDLQDILEKHYRDEVRTKIRLTAIQIVEDFLKKVDKTQQDIIITEVLLPYLQTLASDPDDDIRLKGTKLIVDLALHSFSPVYYSLVDVLRQITLRAFNQPSENSTQPPQASPSASPNRTLTPTRKESSSTSLSSTAASSEASHSNRNSQIFEERLDIKEAVAGAVKIFNRSLYQAQPSRCAKIFNVLIEYIALEYDPKHFRVRGATERLMILQCFLNLRSDGKDRLGMLTGEMREGYPVVSYSSLVLCHESNTSLAADDVTCVPYLEVFHVFILTMGSELHWPILQCLLNGLLKVFQNSSLLRTLDVKTLRAFNQRLLSMVNPEKQEKGQSIHELLLDKPQDNFRRSDFHAHVFPVMCAFIPHMHRLDRGEKEHLIRCLDFGMNNHKAAAVCIRGLMLCCLEMAGTISRWLGPIIVRLSQLSASTAIANPLMEFLSTACHLPKLHLNFTDKQYLAVFATAVPFTNPFRYSHYIVSLAYHVIATWFLKCRLSMRRTIVSFIIRGLRSNVLQQFEETGNHQPWLRNQSSTDRLRVQSLNDEALRRANKEVAAAARQNAKTHAEMSMLHKDLMQTCIDLLVRYTFSNYTSQPRRSPVTRFLLEGGQELSWLVGHKIITVTTSGGSQVTRAGLCEKCLGVARAATSQLSQSNNEEKSPHSTRRRHRSAFTRSLSESMDAAPDDRRSQDDLMVSNSNRRLQGDGSAYPSQSDTRLPRIPSEDGESSKEDLRAVGSRDEELTRPPLETTRDKQQAVDEVLMALKARPSDKSIFTSRQCNCWCTQWAEIKIRRPTGSMAWVMRLENEQDLIEIFPDFSLHDISNLFAVSGYNADGLESVSEEQIQFLQGNRPIASQQLGEKEYELLWQRHFQGSDLTGQLAHKVTSYDAFMQCMLSPASESDQSLSQDPESSQLQSGDASSLSLSDPASASVARASSASLNALDSVKDEQTGETVEDKNKNISTSTSSTQPTTTAAQPSANLSTTAAAQPSTNPPTPAGEASKSSTSSPSHVPSNPDVSSSRHNLSKDSGGSSGMVRDRQELIRGGISPGFLFLQLYHTHVEKLEERPLPIKRTEDNDRSMYLLDLIYPYETYKIGVLYIGLGQADSEKDILANQVGSPRYMKFVEGLGQLVSLKGVDQSRTYIGGLSDKGTDGEFTYAWHDAVMQVVFHITTMMPLKDDKGNFKKRHIGNDFVNILYNDSKQSYKLSTLKTQFNFVNIVIEPLDNELNAVTVQTKPSIEAMIGQKHTQIISDAKLSFLVRQMAIHANLASIIESRPSDPYASNWLERLRLIKRFKGRLVKELQETIRASTIRDDTLKSDVDDFTEYT